MPLSGFNSIGYVPLRITPLHRASIGVELAAGNAGAPASAAWGQANTAVFIPFRLLRPATVKKLFWHNGATAAGNVDCGIYTEAGARVVSTGSTAQAVINVIQEVDVADVTLAPGCYFIGIVKNDIVGTFFRVTFPTSILHGSIVGIREQAAAFPLPANAVLATRAAALNGIIPMCGASLQVQI